MQNASKEEYLASLRRRSSGFSRGVSKYRGVARHHHNGRWEARIGRVFGNKYLYLGTFSSQEEAAAAYDLAAIEYRGPNAVTNFDISNYIGRVKNLMPTNTQTQTAPDPDKSQPVQLQPIKQQEEEEENEQQQQDQRQQGGVEVEVEEEQDLQQVRKQEEMEMAVPSQLEEAKLDISSNDEEDGTKLDISSNDESPMLVMGPPHVDDEDGDNNPWGFCLDTGGYDPLLVPDIPLEEDGRVLDLFDQTGFEDNIDFIFDFGGTSTLTDAQTGILKPCVDSNNNIDISSKLDNSFSSSSSPSSPSSTTSLL